MDYTLEGFSSIEYDFVFIETYLFNHKEDFETLYMN